MIVRRVLLSRILVFLSIALACSWHQIVTWPEIDIKPYSASLSAGHTIKDHVQYTISLAAAAIILYNLNMPQNFTDEVYWWSSLCEFTGRSLWCVGFGVIDWFCCFGFTSFHAPWKLDSNYVLLCVSRSVPPQFTHISRCRHLPPRVQLPYPHFAKDLLITQATLFAYITFIRRY